MRQQLTTACSRLYTILTLYLAIVSTTITTGQELPSSVLFEQREFADELLLIQVKTSTEIETLNIHPCGPDTYYLTSALVLGVNRTLDENPVGVGDTIEFKTYEREWIEGMDGCEGSGDPGVKEVGWCGYIYLIQGGQVGVPYVLGVGGQSFEELDPSVCVSMENNLDELIANAEKEITETGDGVNENGVGGAGGSSEEQEPSAGTPGDQSHANASGGNPYAQAAEIAESGSSRIVYASATSMLCIFILSVCSAFHS